MPTETPVCPVSPERIEAARLNGMASDRASATPLPGAASAFIKGGIKAGPYEVRKVVLADWKIWQALDSPFLRLFLELQNPEDQREEISFTDEEEAVICWQFTQDVREVDRAVKELGKAEVTRRAANLFQYGEESDATKAIVTAVMEQFQRHILTRLKYATEQKDSGEISFFRQSGPTG